MVPFDWSRTSYHVRELQKIAKTLRVDYFGHRRCEGPRAPLEGFGKRTDKVLFSIVLNNISVLYANDVCIRIESRARHLEFHSDVTAVLMLDARIVYT